MDGIVCLVLADCADLLSLNELFGNYSFDATGKIIPIYPGKLIKVNEHNFALNIQKKEKVRNLLGFIYVFCFFRLKLLRKYSSQKKKND